MKKIILTIIGIGLVAFGGWYVITQLGKGPVLNDSGISTWVTYRNTTYGFEIKHPNDWAVLTSDTELDPKINIYKKSETAVPPFTHHNDIANVSIFPRGVATEGVLGTTTPSTVAFGQPIDQAVDFVLENGDRWATFASFKDLPSSWQEYGFVWARATINNHVQTCTLNGEDVPVDRCHALGDPGAVLTDSGNVNSEERAIEEEILKSFRFIEE